MTQNLAEPIGSSFSGSSGGALLGISTHQYMRKLLISESLLICSDTQFSLLVITGDKINGEDNKGTNL